MRKSFLECVVIKYRRVIVHYISLYDGRVHREIFKDCTLFEVLAAFFVMADFHCWIFVDYYCIKY